MPSKGKLCPSSYETQHPTHRDGSYTLRYSNWSARQYCLQIKSLLAEVYSSFVYVVVTGVHQEANIAGEMLCLSVTLGTKYSQLPTGRLYTKKVTALRVSKLMEFVHLLSKVSISV